MNSWRNRKGGIVFNKAKHLLLWALKFENTELKFHYDSNGFHVYLHIYEFLLCFWKTFNNFWIFGIRYNPKTRNSCHEGKGLPSYTHDRWYTGLPENLCLSVVRSQHTTVPGVSS